MILSVDSQLLNAIQACEQKKEYQFDENLAPQDKARALEMGDLMHKCLEIYDGLRGKCANEDSETWTSVREFGLLSSSVSDLYDVELKEVVKLAVEAGQRFAARMSLKTEDSSAVLFQLKEYCEYYANDPWSTLAVEEVATKVLHEDEELTILYNGKIDRVVKQGNIRAPMDHKTSERRSDPSSLSNQFIGYCWLLEMNNIIIDKIGFQKTLKPPERFQRYILTIDDARISEWQSNSVASIFLHLAMKSEDEDFSVRTFQKAKKLKGSKTMMNLTSCDKYGSCIYSSICESNPEGRSWRKERDFIIGSKWDVAGILEAK